MKELEDKNLVYIGIIPLYGVQAPPKPIDPDQDIPPTDPKRVRRTKLMGLPYADNLSHLRKF